MSVAFAGVGIGREIDGGIGSVVQVCGAIAAGEAGLRNQCETLSRELKQGGVAPYALTDGAVFLQGEVALVAGDVALQPAARGRRQGVGGLLSGELQAGSRLVVQKLA